MHEPKRKLVEMWDCGVGSHRHYTKDKARWCMALPYDTPKKKRERNMARAHLIFDLRQEGKTFHEIGKIVELSRSRVWQIFKTVEYM